MASFPFICPVLPLPGVNRETAPFRCGFSLRLQTFGTLSGGIALLFLVKHSA
jgi:hypothetical protein